MQPVAGIFPRFADLERQRFELAGEHRPLQEIHPSRLRKHTAAAPGPAVPPPDEGARKLPSKTEIDADMGTPCAPSVLCASRSCRATRVELSSCPSTH